MIKISDMRNRIMFLRCMALTDAVGNHVNGYELYCQRWAYVNKVSGGEVFTAGTVNEKEKLNFTVRFDRFTKQVTPGEYRILFKGKTYNIKSVDNFKFKNVSITFTAEEV